MPFISVVIPTHNRLPLLKQALESVHGQTYTDFEIIVVDDGSTDGTSDYILNNEPNIILIRQNNLGPGAARNAGIKHAKGKYISFLDSDDLWFPWTLENFFYAIEKHDSPSIISGSHIDINFESKVENAKEKQYQEILYVNYLDTSRDELWLGMCATVIRRDLLRGNEIFSSQDINCEDHDLWLSLGTAPGFIYIKNPPLFAYRRHADSRVSDIERTIAGCIYLIQCEKNLVYPGGEELQYQRWNILGRHIRPVVIACIRNYRINDAWKLYSSIFKCNISNGRYRFIFGVPLLLLITLIKKNL